MANESTRKASCELENELFKSVIEKTPDYIKKLNLIDLNNKNPFIFTLKREYLYEYDKDKNPEGLGLWKWFENYKKEAKVSTAGIRGPQNIIYPQDTRFPINLIGITLATVAKALVINEKGYENPVKLLGREVRYNSELYLEAIARIQAAYGIKTLVPSGKKTIPVWLASFLVFKLSLLGGEYITSSHGISVKNATKDLNSQGGQYLPEESMEFVNKIREIFKKTEKEGYFDIKFAAADDPLIDEKELAEFDDGIDLYVDYLKTGVGRKFNIEFIEKIQNKIVIENVGGSAYRTLSRILDKFNISDKYDWLDTEEDPFFYSIGKYNEDYTGKKGFYDYSVDASLNFRKDNGEKWFPVIDSMHFDERLAKYPVNTVVLITDPDHDRLTVTQIESSQNIKTLEELGIDYIKLSSDRILTVFTANQTFLMLMNCRMQKLKAMGIWADYPRFIIKTTASSIAWDEWAEQNGVKVVNVPVGFKEIASIMKKVETQIQKNPDKEVIIHDVFDREINLGVQPRLLFGGEESGGMIVGPGKLIQAKNGYEAIAMREKSATEAIIMVSSLLARLENDNMTLSQNFAEVLKCNNIIRKYDAREDVSYYNESETDIKKLHGQKKSGEEKRTKNDLFYLALAMGVEYNIINLEQLKEILNSTFEELNFSNLEEIKFVGDGTYFKFDDKFIEIRPSGTDAKTKAYSAGLNKDELEKYTKIMGNYSGDRTDLYKKLIPEEFYMKSKEKAMDEYLKFTNFDK